MNIFHFIKRLVFKYNFHKILSYYLENSTYHYVATWMKTHIIYIYWVRGIYLIAFFMYVGIRVLSNEEPLDLNLYGRI